MKKTSITIAIPAYNEEANIAALLRAIVKQNTETFMIKQILLYSDGSDDTTVESAKKVHDRRVQVIDGKQRRGIAHAQNTLFKKATSDIVVLLNADVALNDPYFIQKLIYPIQYSHADLTSSRVSEVNTRSFFEHVLQQSMQYKNSIFEATNAGNNVYTCHGLARGLSRRLYKKMLFPFNTGEDAYSYFFCVKNNYSYQYVPSVEVLYKAPTTYHDHKKQSLRFFNSKKKIAGLFGETYIHNAYRIPLKTTLVYTLYFACRQPFYFLSYLVILVYLKVISIFDTNMPDLWEVSTSTKILQKTT